MTLKQRSQKLATILDPCLGRTPWLSASLVIQKSYLVNKDQAALGAQDGSRQFELGPLCIVAQADASTEGRRTLNMEHGWTEIWTSHLPGSNRNYIDQSQSGLTQMEASNPRKKSTYILYDFPVSFCTDQQICK